MNVRRVAVLTAAVAGAVGMLPASAAPMPETETYEVTAPVPFPVTNATPPLDGCWNGQETLTRHTRPISFKVPGTLSAQVDYFGDWDLLLFDAKGAKAAAAETTDAGTPATANKEKIVFKKMKPGAEYTLVVCNWLGQPDATVTYTFTPAK